MSKLNRIRKPHRCSIKPGSNTDIPPGWSLSVADWIETARKAMESNARRAVRKSQH